MVDGMSEQLRTGGQERLVTEGNVLKLREVPVQKRETGLRRSVLG